jgi:plastocyanin
MVNAPTICPLSAFLPLRSPRAGSGVGADGTADQVRRRLPAATHKSHGCPRPRQRSNPPAQTSTAGPAGVHDRTFDPAQLNVAPGTTVTWTNGDTEAHTVTADNGLFDSGVIEPGQYYSTWLGGSGTVEYHCEIHPDMKGSVVVGGGAGGGGETSVGDPASSTPPPA